ncbi:MAG: hypothetical protein JW936_01350 [Sedimentisphaerales bacterium]|nr:hypothetical protein [Sedimentisphaerales bacterium]
MGAQLLSFYDQAKAAGSLKAQMRLAMITGVPSSKAAAEPDSPDNLAKFQAAMTKIQAEFK